MFPRNDGHMNIEGTRCTFCGNDVNPTCFIQTGYPASKSACWECRDFFKEREDTRIRYAWELTPETEPLVIQVLLVSTELKSVYVQEKSEDTDSDIDVLELLPQPPHTYIGNLTRHRMQGMTHNYALKMSGGVKSLSDVYTTHGSDIVRHVDILKATQDGVPVEWCTAVRILKKWLQIVVNPVHIRRKGTYYILCGGTSMRQMMRGTLEGVYEEEFNRQCIETLVLDAKDAFGQGSATDPNGIGQGKWIHYKDVAKDASVGDALACALAWWANEEPPQKLCEALKGVADWSCIPGRDVWLVNMNGQQEKIFLAANYTCEFIQNLIREKNLLGIGEECTTALYLEGCELKRNVRPYFLQDFMYIQVIVQSRNQ